MKKNAKIPYIAACGAVLLLVLLLARGLPAPAPGEETTVSQSGVEQEQEPGIPSGEQPSQPDTPGSSVPDEPPEQEPAFVELGPAPELYTPQPGMTAHALVSDYFEVQYAAYVNLQYVDMSAVLDLGEPQNTNLQTWSRLLAQRRRLLAESELCYVETRALPYTIVYDSGPEDGRMDYWEPAETGGTVLHFRILGEKGRAYPPIMAVNAQHTMFLRQVGDEWVITRHYFPGSDRMFARAGSISMPPDDEALARLEDEFRVVLEPEGSEVPLGASYYVPANAAAYAMSYTEEPDLAFRHAGDRTGGSAGFVSQCVWSGLGGGTGGLLFGERYYGMTDSWHSGEDGSPAWTDVNGFWTYITTSSELHGDVFMGASLLEAGDVIQTRVASAAGEDGRFNHAMLVVDGRTLLLAQNSPGCFVYYADLPNTEVRMVRPVYLTQ